MGPGKFMPHAWKEHTAIRRNKIFRKLDMTRRSWIEESHFPDWIGNLDMTEHKTALREMLNCAFSSPTREQFVGKFSGYMSKYGSPPAINLKKAN